MAKVKHLSDGVNTWDVGGGTEVFTSNTDNLWNMSINVASVSVSGSTATLATSGASVVGPDGTTYPGLAPAPSFGIQAGDTIHFVLNGTLPADTVDTIAIGMFYTLNLSQAGSMIGEYYGTVTNTGYPDSTLDQSAAPAPVVYDRLKVVAPLKVTNDGTDDCLGADFTPTKRVRLEYDVDAAEWKTYVSNTEIQFSEIRIGDIITVMPYNVELPGNFRFIGSLKDTYNFIYLKYANALETTGIAITDGSGTIEVLTITPNYAQWKGIYAQDQKFSSSSIYAESTVDDIAEKLRSLKNVVDINDDFTDANYILFGYGPNGIIQNLNSSVYRIMYDDGSFAMIYYPEAGTIPDGITPGFTSGAGSTPPAGNWQPRLAYDSVFFFSGSTKCSKGLQYNGQGFYGTPASGSGVYYTNNTNYFIVFGHLNDKYMQLEN